VGRIEFHRRLNPPAPLDLVVFRPDVFAHIVSFLPPRVLHLRTVLMVETCNYTTTQSNEDANTQKRSTSQDANVLYTKVSSVWCATLVVALRSLHTRTCLVSLITDGDAWGYEPLHTVTERTRHRAVDDLHVDTLLTLSQVIHDADTIHDADKPMLCRQDAFWIWTKLLQEGPMQSK
jgi:hypothetical protein